MGLLRTFPSESDESPLGFFRRLAEENRYASWGEMAGAADVSRSRTGLLGQPEYVAKTLGLKPQWTKDLAVREVELRALQRFQRGLFDAVCPLCLDESVHVRAHWEHVYSTACGRHRLLLVDRCPRCSSRLSVSRPRIAACQCGQNLRTLESEPALASQAWLSAAIAGQHSGRHRPKPRLKQLDLVRLTKVVKILCSMHQPGTAPPRRNAAVPRTVAEAVEFLRPLDELLRDWPQGFERHVANRLELSSPAARTLNSALGHWYMQIKKLCADSEDLPFLGCINQVAATRFAGLIGLDATGSRGITADKLLLTKQAAKKLGVRREAVIAAIDSKVLEGRKRQLGERRLMYQVSDVEVERASAARAKWTDEGPACRRLDVPPGVLSALVSANAIAQDRRWREDFMKGGPFSIESMALLEARLRAVEPHADEADEVISLRELTSRRVGDKSALRAVFAAIAGGGMRSVGPHPSHGIGGYRYRLLDVREFFGTPLVEAGMTIEALTRATGWKYESVCHWIDAEFLQAETITLRGQPCRVVMPQQLLKFSREYMPLADVAKALGTTPSGASKRLKGVALVGAKILPNGVGRGALVRVSELAHLAVKGASLPGSVSDCHGDPPSPLREGG